MRPLTLDLLAEDAGKVPVLLHTVTMIALLTALRRPGNPIDRLHPASSMAWLGCCPWLVHLARGRLALPWSPGRGVAAGRRQVPAIELGVTLLAAAARWRLRESREGYGYDRGS